MRTANNKPTTIKAGLRDVALSTAVVGFLTCVAGPALAAEPPALPAPPMTSIAPAAINIPAPLDVPAAENTKKSGGEDKVTDGAKSMLRKLDSMSDVTSLDDLNKARQVVARIDAMIEIEKKLGELEKVRNDRSSEKSGKGAANLASAIPASALTPPPALTPASMPSLTSAFRPVESKPKPVASALEVSRIVGSQGRYTATIAENGAPKTVGVGDKIGGSTVRSITAQAVTVDDGGSTRTLRVKNVDTIFSAMR